MALTHRQNIAVGMGMLVIFFLTGVVTYTLTRPDTVGQPVPVLNNMQVIKWLNDDVAFVRCTIEPPDFLIANLRTGQLSRLPTPPPLPRDKRRGDGSVEAYVRAERGLSPDGKWLLYKESHVWGWMDSGGILGTRWRLLSTSEGTSRFWPAGGAFFPASRSEREDSRGLVSATQWLPNSRGWVQFELRDQERGDLTRYDLATTSPISLPFPKVESVYQYRRTFPTGQALFVANKPGPTAFQLLPLLPSSPPAMRRTLPLSAEIIGVDTQAVIGIQDKEIVRKGFSLWLAHRLRQSERNSEIWRFPLNGDAPQKLLTFSNDESHFALSNDQKTLFYWAYKGDTRGSYCLPLP